ncbi:hypothetical protein MCOR25_002129 [Pyricularia grisea]|nr:hypothetical protein MCOR25_002129 [Pyricularia grisea]
MDVKQTIEGVHAITGGTATLGILKLTDYHIIFCVPPPAGSPSNTRPRENFISYPILNHCAFRPTPPSSGIPSSIRLRCRDFSYVTFNIPDDKTAREAFDFIKTRTCKLGSIEKLYAFTYQPTRPERGLNGWALYDARDEFRRQGVSAKAKDLGWRISDINKDYVFSPTYPSVLVVPTSISDNVLKYAANHRSRARIPTLTYLHPVNNCAITRSSQPCVGLRGNRSIQDERLVGACFSAAIADSGAGGSFDSSPSTSQTDSPVVSVPEPGLTETDRHEDAVVGGPGTTFEFDEKTGKRVIYGATRQNLIVDARPAINSYAMQAIGLGSENMDYYKFAKKVFLNIDNIHVMRAALNKVIEAIKEADVSPLPPNKELLAKSGWLKHINGILEGSHLIARQVGIYHSNVLIHCSDGWDRTSQLSALSQIMLDPFYRTIDGFIILVEKDWLSFGHMFQRRSGFLNHEQWFVTQNDAMSGVRIEPNENESRGEALENAMASAKRFFSKNLSQDKDDSDGEAGEGYNAKNATAPVSEDQATRPKEISPVFHQFLDATYQLVRQNPTRFEFNERFLRRLLYHLYSCQYGTFLFNNEKQRKDAKVEERTSSVWNYFLSRRPEFTNPEYDPVVDDMTRGKERLLFPREGEIRWWHQLFSRRDEEMNGALDEAASAAEKIATYQSMSSGPQPNTAPGTPHPPGSPKQAPPSLPTSKSVLVGVESGHPILTPEKRPAELPRRSSASTSELPEDPLGALQEGLGNIKVQQGVKRVVGKSGGIGASGQNGSGGVSGSSSTPGGESGKELATGSQPSTTPSTVKQLDGVSHVE